MPFLAVGMYLPRISAQPSVSTATILLHQDGDTDQAVVALFVLDYRDNQRPRSLRHKLIATCECTLSSD